MVDPDKYRQISASAMSNFPLYPPTFREKEGAKRNNESIGKEKKEASAGIKASDPKRTKTTNSGLSKRQEKRPVEMKTSDSSFRASNRSKNLSQTKEVSDESQNSVKSEKKKVEMSKGGQSSSVEKEKVKSESKTTHNLKKESKINGVTRAKGVEDERKVNGSDNVEKSEKSLKEQIRIDQVETSVKEVAKSQLKTLMDGYQNEENEGAQTNGVGNEANETEGMEEIGEVNSRVLEIHQDRKINEAGEEANRNEASVMEHSQSKKLDASRKEPAKSAGYRESFRTTAKFEQYRQMRGSARRSCLKKYLPNKPIEAAINRPKFMRCKSSIPARFKVNVPMETIKNRWNQIKEEERRRMSSDSEPESISMLYEINKPKKPLEMIFEEEVESPVEMYRESLRRAMSDSDIFFRDVVFEQLR